MRKSLNYCWRLFITGLCFLMFSLIGFLLSLLVMPFQYLLFRGGKESSVIAKYLIKQFFALMIGVLRLCGVMRLDIRGLSRLVQSGNVLVLANHPTLIDVVVLLSLMPDATCVVKSAVWKHPFFGGIVRSANYISNSEPETLIDDCAVALSEGQPLVIFPEGTRSKTGQPLKFLRGAAYIALKSGAPILPVLLHCDPPTMTKEMRWYQIPERAFHFTVEVLPPLDIESLIETDDAPAIAARKLTEALESFFSQELQPYGTTAT